MGCDPGTPIDWTTGLDNSDHTAVLPTSAAVQTKNSLQVMPHRSPNEYTLYSYTLDIPLDTKKWRYNSWNLRCITFLQIHSLLIYDSCKSGDEYKYDVSTFFTETYPGMRYKNFYNNFFISIVEASSLKFFYKSRIRRCTTSLTV